MLLGVLGVWNDVGCLSFVGFFERDNYFCFCFEEGQRGRDEYQWPECGVELCQGSQFDVFYCDCGVVEESRSSVERSDRYLLFFLMISVKEL